ncbi:hypothetical protein MY5147_007595 [Beauveria neobassiana]
MDSQEQLRALVEQDKNMLRSVDFDNFRSAPQLDAQAHSSAQGLPPISMLPLAGQYPVRPGPASWGAKEVLEVGTLGGYSFDLLRAGRRARVTSNRNRRRAPRTWRCKNVAGLDVEVLLGSSTDVLPEFDWAVKLTRPNGCIFLDDVVASLFKDGQVG